jgi:hypothetical protein
MANTEDDFRSAMWIAAVSFVVGGCNLLLCGSCHNVTISRSKELLQLTNTHKSDIVTLTTTVIFTLAVIWFSSTLWCM